MNEAKPFIKWVGGKTGLLTDLVRLVPKKYKAYHEPFLGGGALFFCLQPKKAFLNDINTSLIGVYKVIQTNPEALLKELARLKKEYSSLSESDRKVFFLSVRKKYNENKKLKDVVRAAYMIFLNKTCFNGMYRENSKGEFNVPFGKNPNPGIVDIENIRAVSKSLKNVVLSSTSFETVVKNAKKGDFVYFDPPYFPVSKTSNFTSYTKHAFEKEQQVKLYDAFVALDKKGCYVMLSNSYSDFIISLFKLYRQEVVYAGRSINSKGGGRGKVKELVVLNY